MLLLVPAASEAGTHTWTGGGGNGLWTTAANWTGGAPTAGEAAPVTLIFPGSIQATNNIAGLTVDKLVFSGSPVTPTFSTLHGSGGASLIFRGAGGVNLETISEFNMDNTIAATLPVTMNSSNYFSVSAVYHKVSILSVVSGAGSLTLGGGGDLYLGGTQANTISGKVTAQSGSIFLSKTAGLNAVAGAVEARPGASAGYIVVENANQIPDASAVTITGGCVLRLYADETLANLSLGGQVQGFGGTLTLSANPVITASSHVSAPLSLGGVTRTFNVPAGMQLTLVGAIANGGAASGLTKTGNGTLILGGANTFSGAVTISAGTVQADSDGAFGTTAGGVTVPGGTTLRLNSVDVGAEALSLTGFLTVSGTNSWAGAVTLPTETSISITNGTQLTFSGAVGGAGSLSKSGSGTLVFSGTQANTFAGGLGFTAGTVILNKTGVNALVGPISIGPGAAALRLQQIGQIADTVPVGVYAGSTFDLNSNSETIGSLEGNGSVNLLFATLTTGGNNNSTTFSGSMGGIGGAPFIKNGSGTFTLTGTNSLLGTASVNSGALVVNGEMTCHVALATGTTLTGSGKVGNVTGTSAHLQPGGTPGKLTTGNLQLNSSAGVSTFEIFGTTPGAAHDQIAVTGTVTLNNPTLALTVGTAGGLSNQIVLIANDGADAVTGTFNGLPEGATVNAGLVSYKISYVGGTGNDVVLTQTGIPPRPRITSIAKQPGGAMLLGGTGLVSTVYFVEVSTNLISTNWTAIDITASSGSGVIGYTDSDAPTHPKRFYRFRQP